MIATAPLVLVVLTAAYLVLGTIVCLWFGRMCDLNTPDDDR